jgi:hypothetical protein
LDHVYQFRVTQETRENLKIQIVPAPGFDRATALAFLENTILRHGDPCFRVHFELCAELPAAASGKFRFTTSKVPLELESKHAKSAL